MVVVSSNVVTVAGLTPEPTIWLGMFGLVSYPPAFIPKPLSLIYYRYRHAGKTVPVYYLSEAVLTRVRCALSARVAFVGGG